MRFRSRVVRIVVRILVVCCVLAAAGWGAWRLLDYPNSGVEPDSAITRFTLVPSVNVEENRMSGVNLGVAIAGLNGGDWGIELNQGDFDALEDAGFHYIRVPVQFLRYLAKDESGYGLDEAMLKRLDHVLNSILDRGMVAIVDFHFLLQEDVYSFGESGEARKTEDEFLAIWEIVANRYRDYPPTLYFELANEPRKPIMPEDWNRYVAGGLEVIRSSGGGNETRIVVVANPILIGPVFGSWENVRGIDDLVLPSASEDPNIVVTFHYYDPVPFTYQGQTYNETLRRYSWLWDGNHWANTDRQLALVRSDFDHISAWADANDRDVILGEFGVSVFADVPSQLLWTELIREEAESRGMTWIFWQFFYEYDGDTLGGIYSQSGGFWRSEMVDALQTTNRRLPAGVAAEPAADQAHAPATAVLSPEEVEQIEALRQTTVALTDPEWTVRLAAAEELTDVADLTRDAAAALAQAVSSDDEWQVRRAAADALYAHQAMPEVALQGLMSALDDAEWQVRRSAIRSIGRMGQAAEAALPRLMQLSDDSEWQVREAALLAMVHIAPDAPAVTRSVWKAMADSEEHIRETAETLTRHPGLPWLSTPEAQDAE